MKKTQDAFAEILGVSKVTVSRMESGAHSPQRRHLEKFMQVQNEFDNRKSNVRHKGKQK
jgi:transcriptional regulator with XRE-family HTH domain